MVYEYRKNLYDSRQQGRVDIETAIMKEYLNINHELHSFAHSMRGTDKCHDLLDRQFLKFPKSQKLIEDISHSGFAQITENGDLTFQCKDQSHWLFLNPKSEPILGVIGTKYQYWTWEPRTGPF